MGIRAKQALAVVASLLVAGVMILLGLWQMRSYEESTRDVSAERAAQPAVSLPESVGDDGTVADIYGRQVFAEGTYRPEQVLIGSEAPLRVVTLFEMSDGRCVAVVRGAVDASEQARPVDSGASRLTGVFLAADRSSDEPPAAGAKLSTLRLQSLAQDWPCPLIGGYVTVSAEESIDAGMRPAELVLPEAEGSATHRGYALQWWVFAGGAIAFGIYTARHLARASRAARVD